MQFLTPNLMNPYFIAQDVTVNVSTVSVSVCDESDTLAQYLADLLQS